MKRCSGCDRTYADDKLSFCNACGGALVVETGQDEPAYDPLKTMVAAPRPSAEPRAASPAPPAPRVPAAASVRQPSQPPVNPSWADIAGNVDPLAPGEEPSRTLALASMICGIVALVSCGLLSFLGPVALILGIIASRKEKASPQLYYGGKFALTGIITGILATLAMFVVVGALTVVIFSGTLTLPR